MRKQKHTETEYIPQDPGIYRTGSVNTPAGGSAIIALVLALLVLLVGMLTTIGVINLQSVQQMLQSHSTMPLSKDPLSQPAESQGLHPEPNGPMPQAPKNRIVELALEYAPHFSSLPENTLLTTGEIYEKNAQSLLSIHCITRYQSTLTGIAVVLTQDGYLLTNAHLVDSSSQILVELSDGQLLRAALVGSDPFTDLAVLYIDRDNLTPASFCITGNLQSKEPTYSLDALNAENVADSMRLTGIFGVTRMLATNQDSLRLVQTYQGADQGPVFNCMGQIIGLQAGRIAGYFHPDDTKGLGLIVPSDVIREVVLQLTNTGHIVHRPHLGVEVETVTPMYQQYWHLPEGMLLTHIHPGSSAQAQGLKPGDILLMLDGEPVTDRESLYRLLYSKELGEQVTAVIYRDQKKFTVKLTVQSLLQMQQ